MTDSRELALKRTCFVQQIDADYHFHRAFDDLPGVYFFAKNLEGETLFFSRGLLTHHGLLSDDEMIGKTDWELTPGEWAKRYLQDDKKVIETGEPMLHICELWYDDVGLPDFFLTNKYPLKNSEGKTIGVMGVIQKQEGIAIRGHDAEEIFPAIALLREDLSSFPALEVLAEKCICSTRQLERKFKSILGMSPRTYWMKNRIRMACDLIRNSRRSLCQIANDLGFCDQSSFTQQFKKHAGVTPRRFQQLQTSRASDSPSANALDPETIPGTIEE